MRVIGGAQVLHLQRDGVCVNLPVPAAAASLGGVNVGRLLLKKAGIPHPVGKARQTHAKADAQKENQHRGGGDVGLLGKALFSHDGARRQSNGRNAREHRRTNQDDRPVGPHTAQVKRQQQEHQQPNRPSQPVLKASAPCTASSVCNRAQRTPAPEIVAEQHPLQTGELNSWGEADEAYLFYYYMAYHNTYVASVSGRNRIQIVYSPSKHQVVYGNGNLCPILTQEVVSSKEVYSLDENEAIALAKKALSEAGIKDARFVSAKPVYVNNFGDISFEDQTMTLIPAWRVEYTVEKNGKTIRNWLHLNAETGEVYDNTIKL